MNRQNERASKFLFSFKLCRCTPIVRASRAIQAVQIKVAKVLNKILNWRISISDIIPFKIISFARKKDYLSISIDQNDGSKFFFFFLKHSLISSSVALPCSRLLNVLSAWHFFIFRNKKESRVPGVRSREYEGEREKERERFSRIRIDVRMCCTFSNWWHETKNAATSK